MEAVLGWTWSFLLVPALSLTPCAGPWGDPSEPKVAAFPGWEAELPGFPETGGVRIPLNLSVLN